MTLGPVVGPKTAADVPRHQRPALGGDTQRILATDWRLEMCDQSRGKDFLLDWGPEADMRQRMAYEHERNRDVWLIKPDGEKVLPEGAVAATSQEHSMWGGSSPSDGLDAAMQDLRETLKAKALIGAESQHFPGLNLMRNVARGELMNLLPGVPGTVLLWLNRAMYSAAQLGYDTHVRELKAVAPPPANRWWLRPVCRLLGHASRWSPDDADTHCRRCGKPLQK